MKFQSFIVLNKFIGLHSFSCHVCSVIAKLNFCKDIYILQNAMALATEQLSVNIFVKVGFLKVLCAVGCKLSTFQHNMSQCEGFPTSITFRWVCL